jgi:hypothetical protein
VELYRTAVHIHKTGYGEVEKIKKGECPAPSLMILQAL